MALNSSPKPDFKSPSDLDLCNIMYLQNIPGVPEEHRAALNANVKSINSWLAWHLTKVEGSINGKVESGMLPGDTSVASKGKRTVFRIKVDDYLRDQAPWLSDKTSASHTTTLSASEDKIYLDVLHSLLGLEQFPQNQQVLNLVKALAPGYDQKGPSTPQCLLYYIDHKLDSTNGDMTTSIKTFNFSTAIASPRAAPVTRGPSSQPQTVEATINFVHSAAGFNFRLWNENAPQDDQQFALGRQLLAQKQLSITEIP